MQLDGNVVDNMNITGNVRSRDSYVDKTTYQLPIETGLFKKVPFITSVIYINLYGSIHGSSISEFS